jgi:hypothetical protein
MIRPFASSMIAAGLPLEGGPSARRKRASWARADAVRQFRKDMVDGAMPSKTMLAVLGLLFTPLAAISYFYAGPSSEGRTGRSSEGERREAVLAELTAAYVARGDGVTDAMRSGTALAPIAYLNGALAQREALFRVSSTSGLTAETFDIS